MKAQKIKLGTVAVKKNHLRWEGKAQGSSTCFQRLVASNP